MKKLQIVKKKDKVYEKIRKFSCCWYYCGVQSVS